MNDRAHDLADLLLLEELGTIDLRVTNRACVVVFDQRRMHDWPPEIRVRSHWPDLWRNIVEDDGFPIEDVHIAAERVRHLIGRISDAAE